MRIDNFYTAEIQEEAIEGRGRKDLKQAYKSLQFHPAGSF